MPVATSKGIISIEFKILLTFSFYLENVTAEARPFPGVDPWPFMRKIPQQFPETWMRVVRQPENRLVGIETALNRIYALLSQQHYPLLRKRMEKALAKGLEQQIKAGKSVSKIQKRARYKNGPGFWAVCVDL